MSYFPNTRVVDVVEGYLKRRGFINEGTELTDERLIRASKQTAEEKILAETVATNSSKMNSIMCSIYNNDVSQVDNQFIRLVNWVSDMKYTVWKDELKQILWPLFCHLYCEMLVGGFPPAALKFRIKNEGLLFSCEEFRQLFQELKEVISAKDIPLKSLVKDFRSSKYRIKLSPPSMLALENYLSTTHIILVQVIRKWFDFEIFTPNSDYDDTDCDPPLETPNSSDEQVCDNSVLGSYIYESPEPKTEFNEIRELNRIQDVIDLVNMNPTFPGPILLYTISNAYKRVQCARLSESPKQLAFGLQNEICVRNLGIARSRKPRLTRLPMDRFETEEESDDEYTEKVIRLRAHVDLVQDIRFIKGSDTILLSVSQDGDMRAWNLSDSTCAAVYRGHNVPIWCVATSCLKEHIATGSHDRTVKLWSLERLYPLRSFARHSQDVECVDFHPNGLYVASGSTDKTVRMFDINSANEVRCMSGHNCAIQCMAFSPNGKLIATGGEDKMIRIWDLSTAQCIAEFGGHAGPVVSMSWSSNSEHLTSCDLMGKLYIWNLLTVSDLHYKFPKPELCHYNLDGSTPILVQHMSYDNLACVRLTDDTFPKDTKEEDVKMFSDTT